MVAKERLALKKLPVQTHRHLDDARYCRPSTGHQQAGLRLADLRHRRASEALTGGHRRTLGSGVAYAFWSPEAAEA